MSTKFLWVGLTLIMAGNLLRVANLPMVVLGEILMIIGAVLLLLGR